MNLYEKIVERWKAQGVLRKPAVGISALDEFEVAKQLKIPSPLRRLLLLSNGMVEGQCDQENQIRFWPLEELAVVSACVPELGTPEYSGYLVFADYSLWAHGYAVSLESGDVVVVGATAPVLVTGSLESFLGMYLRNAPALFP